MNDNQIKNDPVVIQSDQIQSQVNQPTQPKPQPQTQSKKTPLKLIIIIVVGGIIFFITLFCIIFFAISNNSSKLICKSKKRNITIMYNKEELVGYTASGMSYKFDEQKEVAKDMGVDAYIEEFESWFTQNNVGSCEKQEKK